MDSALGRRTFASRAAARSCRLKFSVAVWKRAIWFGVRPKIPLRCFDQTSCEAVEDVISEYQIFRAIVVVRL